MGEQNFRYSVVIPVFNEHEVIGEFCAKAVKHLPPNYELLVCYDRDEDTTLPALAALPPEAKPAHVRLVKNGLGRGVRYAIDTGMRAAKAPIVVVMMADLSDDFEKVDEMVRRAEQGADVVTGSRYMPGGQQIGGPKLKGFLSRMAGLSLYHLGGLGTHDPTNSFKAYRKDFLDVTPIESTAGFVFGMELTLKAQYEGGRVEEVPATWLDRTAGESRFKLMRWLPLYLHWYVWAFGQRLLGRGGDRPASRGWRIADGVTRALLLVWLLLHTVPWAPSFLGRGIENSWRWTLHYAAAHGWVWGKDIAFTFGPLGFLYGGYYPPTHPYMVICWTVMAVAFWAGLVRLARVCMPRIGLRLVWYAVVALTTAVATGRAMTNLGRDGWFFTLLLLLLLNGLLDEPAGVGGGESPDGAAPRRQRHARAQVLALILLALATAIVTMLKFSMLIAAAGVLGIVTCFDVVRRRFPLALVVVLAGQFAIWLLARQPLAAIGPWLRTSWEITSGYGDAMSLTTADEASETSRFLAYALILVVAVALAPRSGRSRLHRLLMLGGLAWMFFLIFKAGYVRHDVHELHAAVAGVMACVMLFPVVWPRAGARTTRRDGDDHDHDDDDGGEPQDPRLVRRRILFAIGVVVAVVATRSTFKEYIPGSVKGQIGRVFTIVPTRVREMGNYFVSPRADAARDFAASLKPIRERARRMPTPRGVTDLYTCDNTFLMATETPFNPRPVFQSYSAYTPHLAEMNADHLRGPHAPDSLLFTLIAIDRRWATLEDGPSYLEMLSRYAPAGSGDKYVLLTRRATPRKLRLEPLPPIAAATGETIRIPDPQGVPLYAELELKPTLAHRLLSLLYKNPTLYMTVDLADGGVFSRRLIPGMAKAGFILSPMLTETADFERLWSGDLTPLDNARVTALGVGVHKQRESKVNPTALFDGYTLRLYRVRFDDSPTTQPATRP